MFPFHTLYTLSLVFYLCLSKFCKKTVEGGGGKPLTLYFEFCFYVLPSAILNKKRGEKGGRGGKPLVFSFLRIVDIVASMRNGLSWQ